MEIKNLKVLRGPNYWSINRTNLIQMTLDIKEFEELPTNMLPGFTDRLVAMLPSLHSHRCSEGEPGGFITRMKEGTWMGHVIEHIALELQCLAGMDCGFGRTRSTGKYGEYKVVFSYIIENAGIHAARDAVSLVKAVAKNSTFDLAGCLANLEQICRSEKLGPSTASIVEAAIARNIPWKRLDTDSSVIFGQGRYQRRIQATIADSTSYMAVELAQDKEEVKKILAGNNIPVPKGFVVANETELENAINQLGYPLAIKPLRGNHGKGVTTHIVDKEGARRALEIASQFDENFIVEQFIRGDDFRFLVINYKVVAVSKRTPAKIVGDGRSTIERLIEKENSNPARGEGHEKVLTKIKVDQQTMLRLQENKLTLQSILPMGSTLVLKDTANLSTGGTAENVTDLVPPATLALMERAARLIGIDICGIDVIAADIQQLLQNKNGAILEVNAAPGFRMHLRPSQGAGRDVGAAVISMLFPAGTESRIPIVGVTGTNGKTTTTRLTAHIAAQTRLHVGCTTTEGIFIDNVCIAEGDCSGPTSANVILQDPLVEYAVFECARGGMLRSGLGFDRCNISIVTNVSEDHLGIDGIQDLETLARVKQIVPEATFENGLVILNADDDYVYKMKDAVTAKTALFSLSAENPRILEHYKNNGIVAFRDKGWLCVGKDGLMTRLIRTSDIPITMGGKYDCMIQNSMAATLAAIGSGFSTIHILKGLRTFLPSADMNLGRMNEFMIGDRKIIVDYAHNAHGFAELKKYLDKVEAPEKTGIITATGDRRDIDIIAIGKLSAQIFDRLIIRHDKDCRGRTRESISKLLQEGIYSIDPHKKVKIISDEQQAIAEGIRGAVNGGLIFMSSDNSRNTIRFVEKLKQSDDAGKHSYYGT